MINTEGWSPLPLNHDDQEPRIGDDGVDFIDDVFPSLFSRNGTFMQILVNAVLVRLN